MGQNSDIGLGCFMTVAIAAILAIFWPAIQFLWAVLGVFLAHGG